MSDVINAMKNHCALEFNKVKTNRISCIKLQKELSELLIKENDSLRLPKWHYKHAEVHEQQQSIIENNGRIINRILDSLENLKVDLSEITMDGQINDTLLENLLWDEFEDKE